MKVSEGFMLRVLNGEFRGQVFPLQGSIDIGSAGDCELCLRDSLVSPSHARLHSDGDDVVIEDLGSSKGTFLNERPVDRASLRPGDLLRIGGTRLSVVSNVGQPLAGSSVDSGAGSDSILARRARAAEARKVELEKARARLTRENEELVQKLIREQARCRKVKKKARELAARFSEREATRLDQKKRLVAGLKSALAAKTRLESELEDARSESSRTGTEQPGRGQAAEGGGQALQERIEAARQELSEQAGNHQEELSDFTRRLQEAQAEVEDLRTKLQEEEAVQAEAKRKLLAHERKAAESASGQDEIRRRLQVLEKENRCLESSASELEQQRQVSVGLRGEVAGLRKEIDSVLDERKLDSRKHRSEITSQAVENRRRLKETEQDISSAFQDNIQRLEVEKTRIAAELKSREEEIEKQASELERALAGSARGEESVARMQQELEQERTSGAGSRVRCAEVEKEKDLLESGIHQQQETIDSQAGALAELEVRLQKVSRELIFFERERKKKEGHLSREVEVLQRRVCDAEKKRQAQEGRLDGLKDSEASRSDELLLLRRYVDDVRGRLLEKEALLQDLRSRLLLEGGEEMYVAGGNAGDAA